MNTVLGALVNGSIAAAVLAAAAMILTSIRIWNATSRYIIWCAALFATVIITVVYFCADALPKAPRSVVVQNQLPKATVVLSTQNAVTLPAQQASPVAADRGITPFLPIRMNAASILRWFGFAWMATSTLMLVRLIASYLLLERRKAAAHPISSDTENRLREVFRAAGVRTRSIRIAVSNEIRGPVAIGPHRPTVLIPSGLIQQLDAFELEQVVLHEAAHLSRRDDYAVFIQRLIQALLVFNPAVHWIAGRIEIEREIACDDFVVLATGKARPYASCLARVAELCGCVAASPLAASAAGSGSGLVRRIETLLDNKRRASNRPMKARLAVAATAILAVTSAGIVAPRLVAFSAIDKPAVSVMQLSPAPSANPIVATTTASVSVPEAAPVKPASVPRSVESQPVAPTVNVQILVTEDAFGRSITGFQKEHFKIFDQGVEQIVTDFAADGPVSVCIVLDGSVINRDVLLEQAKRFLGEDSGNEFWLLASPMSLFDALAAARTQLGAARNSRRAIVIMSDGSRDSMEYSREQVETLAGVTDMPLYSLTPTGLDPLLDSLASLTGGRQFAIGGADDSKTLRKVLLGIRNSYVLGFQPTKTGGAGELHRLLVQVQTEKGLPHFSWQNRAAYYSAAQ